MSLAFLDVSKAFDSVSHATLLLAAERMGAPVDPLLTVKQCHG